MDITGLWRKVPVRDDTDWLMLPYGARGLYLNDFWGGDGQRLRPCPGCLRCRSCVGCEVLTFEGDTCEDCGRETPMATESCNGSGVLPARRAKS